MGKQILYKIAAPFLCKGPVPLIPMARLLEYPYIHQLFERLVKQALFRAGIQVDSAVFIVLYPQPCINLPLGAIHGRELVQIYLYYLFPCLLRLAVHQFQQRCITCGIFVIDKRYDPLAVIILHVFGEL